MMHAYIYTTQKKKYKFKNHNEVIPHQQRVEHGAHNFHERQPWWRERERESE